MLSEKENSLFSVSDVIFIFDSKCVFRKYYNFGENDFFLSKHDFIGKHITKIIQLSDQIKKTTEKLIGEVVKTGKKARFSYIIENQNEYRYFEASFIKVDNNEVYTIIKDITTIKKAEYSEKHNKEYYQNLLECLDHGLVETDIDGNVLYANKSFFDISGMEKAYLFGKNFFKEFSLEEEQKQINDNIKSIENENTFTKIYSTEIKKLGKKNNKYIQLSVFLYFDESMKVDRLIFDIEDITEIKKRHESLEKSENIHRSLVENSPNGILIRDEERILYANQAAISILGFRNLEHAVGFEVENLYLSEFSEIIKKRIESLKNKERITYTEIKIKRPIDGAIIEVETIPAIICFEGKEAYQVVIKDISLQKQLLETKLMADLTEKNYQKLRKEIVIRQEIEHELSKSLEEKSILLKEVHHRVKNNLQIIHSILNLEIRNQSNAHINKVFKRIQSRIHSIYLIHEIVYQTDIFSRIDLGQYIRLISENMIRNSKYEIANFKFCLDTVFVSLDIGVPIGIIINELLYIYFEHYDTFELNQPLKISIKQLNFQTEIKIYYPKEKLFNNKISFVDSILSMQLIDALTDQINGTYKIIKDNKKNTKFILTF